MIQSQAWLSFSKIQPHTELQEDPGSACYSLCPFASLLYFSVWGEGAAEVQRRVPLSPMAWCHHARYVLPSELSHWWSQGGKQNGGCNCRIEESCSVCITYSNPPTCHVKECFLYSYTFKCTWGPVIWCLQAIFVEGVLWHVMHLHLWSVTNLRLSKLWEAVMH